MFIRLTTTTFLATLLTAALGAGCTVSTDNGDSTLTVENEESVPIDGIFVNAVGDDTFTDNLLGDVPLDTGDTITLDVTCDNYDIEITDEAGGDCQFLDYQLCFTDEDWIITDSTCAFSSRNADGTEKTITVPRVMKNVSRLSTAK